MVAGLVRINMAMCCCQIFRVSDKPTTRLFAANQRFEYRQYRAGNKSSMTREHAKLLKPFMQSLTAATSPKKSRSSSSPARTVKVASKPTPKRSPTTTTTTRSNYPGKRPRVDWNEAFAILQDYINKHGRYVDVPAREEYQNFALGRWLANQRYEYRQYKLGNPSRVKPDQLQKLEKLLGDPRKKPKSLLRSRK